MSITTDTSSSYMTENNNMSKDYGIKNSSTLKSS